MMKDITILLTLALFLTCVNSDSETLINKELQKNDDRSFHGAFASTTYIIILSELGDKTFFIAAILAAQNSRLVVFFGAITALVLMSIFSSFFGHAVNVIPRSYTLWISAVLYLLFGLKMLKDGYELSNEDAKEEFEEVQQDLAPKDIETGYAGPATKTVRLKRLFYSFCHPAFVDAMVMCFIAEWGDRSQIATIILAATKDVTGVILGACFGHALCTGLAVLAGRLISYKIPVRWLTIIGGITFILFSLHSVWEASAVSRSHMASEFEHAVNKKAL